MNVPPESASALTVPSWQAWARRAPSAARRSQAEGVGVADHRHDQPPRGVHGEGQVHPGELQDAPFREMGVHLRVAGQRPGHGEVDHVADGDPAQLQALVAGLQALAVGGQDLGIGPGVQRVLGAAGQGGQHALGDHLAHALHRDLGDGAGEVGADRAGLRREAPRSGRRRDGGCRRFCGRCRPGRRCATRLQGLAHVALQDPSSGTAAAPLRQGGGRLRGAQAGALRQPARAGRDGRPFPGAPRRRARLTGLPGRSRGAGRRCRRSRRRGRRAGPHAGFAGLHRLPRLADRRQRGEHRDVLALLAVDRQQGPAHRGRDLEGGLVRLHLHQGLALLHLVPDLLLPAQDQAGFHGLPLNGQDHLVSHFASFMPWSPLSPRPPAPAPRAPPGPCP